MPAFKTMDPDVIREAIEGVEDVLSPLSIRKKPSSGIRYAPFASPPDMKHLLTRPTRSLLE